MSVTYEIKISQTELNSCKSGALFIDATTEKIGLAKFVSVKQDGTSNAPGLVGYTVPTWQVADASSQLPAQGIVYAISPRAVDTTVTDRLTATDSYWYEYGDRETKPLIPVTEAEIVCLDTTRDYYFNTTKKALTGTVEVGAGTLTKIDGTLTTFVAEVRVGDYVMVGTTVRQVSVVNSNTQLTVSAAFGGAEAALSTAYLSTDLFKPVYLAEDGGFTKLVPLSGFKQQVGYIVSGNNVRIDLDDVQGAVV